MQLLASCSYHRPGAQIKTFSSVGCAHLGAHLAFHSSIPYCHFHLLTLQKSLNTSLPTSRITLAPSSFDTRHYYFISFHRKLHNMTQI